MKHIPPAPLPHENTTVACLVLPLKEMALHQARQYVWSEAAAHRIAESAIRQLQIVAQDVNVGGDIRKILFEIVHEIARDMLTSRHDPIEK